jgi:hypothetical protein
VTVAAGPYLGADAGLLGDGLLGGPSAEWYREAALARYEADGGELPGLLADLPWLRPAPVRPAAVAGLAPLRARAHRCEVCGYVTATTGHRIRCAARSAA